MGGYLSGGWRRYYLILGDLFSDSLRIMDKLENASARINTF